MFPARILCAVWRKVLGSKSTASLMKGTVNYGLDDKHMLLHGLLDIVCTVSLMYVTQWTTVGTFGVVEVG